MNARLMIRVGVDLVMVSGTSVMMGARLNDYGTRLNNDGS
jgi:hypothetical protein